MPRPGEHTLGAHAQSLAAGAQHLAVGVVAHCGHDLAGFAQAGEVVQNIAHHAAHGQMQSSGVGIPHDQGREALAVDVHICAADTGDVRFGQKQPSVRLNWPPACGR